MAGCSGSTCIRCVTIHARRVAASRRWLSGCPRWRDWASWRVTAPAVTPDGQTWEMLANRAGGKQSPGIVGVSHQYMHSPDFLKGDGGIANVVWVDSGLYRKIARLFPPGQRVATEQQVSTMADLHQFLGR